MSWNFYKTFYEKYKECGTLASIENLLPKKELLEVRYEAQKTMQLKSYRKIIGEIDGGEVEVVVRFWGNK